MERIIKDDFVWYLEDNNLIYESQHGFRQKRSCLTNLLDFMQVQSMEVDEGEALDMVFILFPEGVQQSATQKTATKVTSSRNRWKSTEMDRGVA